MRHDLFAPLAPAVVEQLRCSDWRWESTSFQVAGAHTSLVQQVAQRVSYQVGARLPLSAYSEGPVVTVLREQLQLLRGWWWWL